jgi:hypothetical protein
MKAISAYEPFLDSISKLTSIVDERKSSFERSHLQAKLTVTEQLRAAMITKEVLAEQLQAERDRTSRLEQELVLIREALKESEAERATATQWAAYTKIQAATAKQSIRRSKQQLCVRPSYKVQGKKVVPNLQVLQTMSP